MGIKAKKFKPLLKLKDMKLAVILYKSKTLAEGEHPIMLRLFNNGKYHYKSIGIACAPSNWNENENKCRKSFGRHKAFNQIIQRQYNAAQERIDYLLANKKPFNIDYVFQINSEKRKTLLEVIQEERAMQTKYNSIRKYINVEHRLQEYKLEYTYIDEVSAEFLERFYIKLKSTRKDISIYTYMATLRSCLSAAVRKKYISENPFIYTNFKYDKQTKKRALNGFDIARLIEYYKTNYFLPYQINAFVTEPHTLTDTKSEYYALNLFLSAYFLQGLSLIDLAELRVKDVVLTKKTIGKKQDFEQYNEKETMFNAAIEKFMRDNPDDNNIKELTTRLRKRKDNIIAPLKSEDIITIELRRSKTNKPVKIVNKYSNLSFLLKENLEGKDDDDYLFNIYNDKYKKNITTKNSRLTYTTHTCNMRLEEVRKKLGLNIDRLTMYSARHTYASMLYHSGANANIIAQNMGRDMRGMEVYLKEFDEDRIIEANSAL